MMKPSHIRFGRAWVWRAASRRNLILACSRTGPTGMPVDSGLFPDCETVSNSDCYSLTFLAASVSDASPWFRKSCSRRVFAASICARNASGTTPPFTAGLAEPPRSSVASVSAGEPLNGCLKQLPRVLSDPYW